MVERPVEDPLNGSMLGVGGVGYVEGRGAVDGLKGDWNVGF